MKTAGFLSGKRLLRTILMAAGVIGLAACGGKDTKPGQAVAKVNGDEITVHQVNEILTHMPPQQGPNNNPEQMRKQALDDLIDRQLLVQEAINSKMDRDPNVMQAVEQAKAQVLAQAYLQSKMASVSKPSKADIDEYYQAHPEFFAQRKTYEVRHITLAAADFTPELSTLMNNAKSLDEAVAWLDAHKVDYAKNQGMSAPPAADLPEQMLSKVQDTDKPQLFVFKNSERVVLTSLMSLRNTPVSLEKATPDIEQFLTRKKSQEASLAEVKRLHGVAKIEYLNQAPTGAEAEKSNKDASAASASSSKPDAGVAGLK